jgi:hypothetical protein
MGITKSTVSSSAMWALLHALVHAFAWVGLIVVLVLLSAKLGTMYQEFELALPVASQLFLSLADMITRYWHVVFPVALVLWAVDLGVLFLLDQSGASRVVGVLWSVAVLAVAGLLLLAILWALLVPLNTLMSDLS